MANEQTSVPLYASSEILTAANMNISAGTGVPVFATTVTRDAAFGGANEKVLAEGQLCYLSSTNVVQYYDGAAWATVGPSAPGGLVLISTTTVGTTVGSVTVSNCFSATYLNYKIWYNGGLSSANNDMTMTIGSATANYNMVFAGANYSANTFVGAGSASAAGFLYVGATETVGGAYANIDLFNPFATANTRLFGANAGSSNAGFIGGILKDTTSHTGFTFTPASGTLTGGTIRVYGYSLT